MIVIYTLGDALDNHSAIALTSAANGGPWYFSWAEQANHHWFNAFVTKAGGWSKIYGRVMIPTQNDRNIIRINENNAYAWHQKNKGEYSFSNCAMWCYHLLEACNATEYESTLFWCLGDAWSPLALNSRAQSIRENAIEKIGGLNSVQWPDRTDALRVFFANEKACRKGANWWVE